MCRKFPKTAHGGKDEGQISLTLMGTSRPLRLDGNNPYRFLPTRVVSTQTLRLLKPHSELCRLPVSQGQVRMPPGEE